MATPNYGIDFSFVDFNKEGALEAAFTEKTKVCCALESWCVPILRLVLVVQMVWLETPTNPTLKISDIKKCAAIAKRHNALLVVCRLVFGLVDSLL